MSGLVLTRYPNQKIKVNGPCEIEIIQVRGNKVRIRFVADLDTNIARSEVYDPELTKLTHEQRLNRIGACHGKPIAETTDAATQTPSV